MTYLSHHQPSEYVSNHQPTGWKHERENMPNMHGDLPNRNWQKK